MLKTTFGKKEIITERPAFVMGILNATPDSFYKNSRGGFELAMKLIEQGADILDIGGESTRPGYVPVEENEEIDRILPLIQQIKKESNVAISVDTSKPNVIKAVLEEGVDIINNVLAFENETDDKNLISIINKDCSVVLMHHTSGNIEQICNYLKKSAEKCEKIGIKKEKIILDAGIGFGKSFEENVQIIKNFSAVKNLGFTSLMALSRKSCIGQMTEKTVEKRLSGTIAANLFSVINGADIIRVHDVEETIDALNVMKYLQ